MSDIEREIAMRGKNEKNREKINQEEGKTGRRKKRGQKRKRDQREGKKWRKR